MNIMFIQQDKYCYLQVGRSMHLLTNEQMGSIVIDYLRADGRFKEGFVPRDHFSRSVDPGKESEVDYMSLVGTKLYLTRKNVSGFASCNYYITEDDIYDTIEYFSGELINYFEYPIIRTLSRASFDLTVVGQLCRALDRYDICESKLDLVTDEKGDLFYGINKILYGKVDLKGTLKDLCCSCGDTINQILLLFKSYNSSIEKYRIN